MKLLCRYWYYIGLGVAIIVGIILAFIWKDADVLIRVQMLSFIAILLHQFEEYGFPGGEPAIMNKVLRGSDKPDRYPLNQFSAMLSNVLISYIVYVLPIVFPNVIWLGLAPILMGMMQFIVHGILTNIKMKSLYNPGLGAVVLLHIPLGIFYINYITTNGLATANDWIFGIIYTILTVGFVLGALTYKILPNENTKYIFSEKEMKKFNVFEKIGDK